MKYEWNGEDPIRVCGYHYGKIELMVLDNNLISLLVLPMNQIYEEKEKGNFYANLSLSKNREERLLFIKSVMIRQNVHLDLGDVQELIEALQDYVRWAIKQNGRQND